VSVTTDSPDWAPHVALASQVAATGVPLLRGTNKLGSAPAVIIGPGATVQLLTDVPVSQPGYEGLFVLNLPAGAGTTPFASVIFNWFDSVTTFNVDSEFFALTAGNGSANALQYYVRGPCHGDQLSLQITNLDGAQNMTLLWVLNQTSHVWLTHRIAQPVYAQTAPVGFTNPSGTPGIGLLAASTPTINPASTTSRLLAACNGKALLAVDNFTGTNAMWCKLVDPGTLYSAAGAVSAPVLSLAAGQVASTEVALPHGPMLLSVRNQGSTGTITPGITLTAMDY
jgi:hypothetical protein